jgi:hypothetical protein
VTHECLRLRTKKTSSRRRCHSSGGGGTWCTKKGASSCCSRPTTESTKKRHLDRWLLGSRLRNTLEPDIVPLQILPKVETGVSFNLAVDGSRELQRADFQLGPRQLDQLVLVIGRLAVAKPNITKVGCSAHSPACHEAHDFS